MSVILRYTAWVRIIEDGVLETKRTFVGKIRPAASFFFGDFFAVHHMGQDDLHQSIWLSWSKSVNGWKWSMWHFNHYSFRYSQLLKRICWILHSRQFKQPLWFNITYTIHTWLSTISLTCMYIYIYTRILYILYTIHNIQESMIFFAYQGANWPSQLQNRCRTPKNLIQFFAALGSG